MAMVHMTPVMVQKWFESYASRMDYPEAFYGSEINSYREDREGNFHKTWEDTELRVLYAAPWPYTEFTGNMTFPILNKLTNEYTRLDGVRPFYSERSHQPVCHKDLLVFERFGIPIFGLETRHVPGDFDIVAFSAGYPPFFANMVKQLHMAGIPVRWKDRVSMDEQYPLIIGGGSTYGSPEPWTPFADFVFIGEAEDEPGNPGLMAVYEDIETAKLNGSFWTADGREDLLHKLAVKYDFLYVPRFITPQYDENNYTKGWDYKYDDLPKRIKKRFVKDFNAVPAMTQPLMPFVDPSMGLGEVEIARGCSAGTCTFCAVGFRYRPYRERSVEFMVEAFKENIKNSGADQAFPCAFEYSGYTRKKELTKRLLEEVTDSVDTQSQRIDNMAKDPNFVMLAGEGDMRNLCVGIEGNSERIRTFVNKGATEEMILKACGNAMKAGFKTLKLYMIADLPIETQEDTDQIVDLCAKIIDLRDAMGAKANVKVSWTPLFIEAWTPLQWMRATAGEKKLDNIANPLRELGITFMLSQGKTERNYLITAQIQHMCDRIAAEALIDTYDELDVSFVGSVNRRMEVTLGKHLEARGVDYAHYFKAKDKDFIFPWDIIDIGVTKDYLWKMKVATEEALRIIDEDGGDPRGVRGDGFVIDKCATSCTNCGVCDASMKKQMREGYKCYETDEKVDLGDIKILNHSSVSQKVRLKVWIDPYYRYPAADYWTALVRRAAFMTEVPITKRTVHFASELLRWKNWVAGVDYVEFGMLDKTLKTKNDLQTLIDKFNSELVPYGLTVLEGQVVSAKVGSLRRAGEYAFYEMPTGRDIHVITNALKKWAEADHVDLIVKEDLYRVGLQSTVLNGKEYVSDLWAVKDGTDIKLKMLVKGQPSPFDVYRAILGRGLREAYKQVPLKLDVFVPQDTGQQDFFRAVCECCGNSIPVNYFDKPLSTQFCPKCEDKHFGRFVG